MTPTTTFDLKTTLQGIPGETMKSAVNAFIAGQGQEKYDYQAHSYLQVNSLVNNLSAPGTIHINPNDVAALADTLGISYLSALKSVLVHEMGHAQFATADLTAYSGDPAKMADWCYQREGEAAAFAFKVTTELKAIGGYLPVAGPPTMPDIYDVMAAAVQGMDPRSTQYTLALIHAAQAKYAADPTYQKFCSTWATKGGLPPGYVPPTPGSPDWGSYGGGGGHAGGGGSALIPGGYWKEVPPPQNGNLTAPVDPATHASPQPESTPHTDVSVIQHLIGPESRPSQLADIGVHSDLHMPVTLVGMYASSSEPAVLYTM